MQYQVDISGTMYGMTDIETANIIQPLFDTLSVGNTCVAELDITVWPKSTIPRMAKIIPYAREIETDSWSQLGIFWIDNRTKVEDKLSITSYDAMLKGEVIWEPRQDFVFPMTMPAAAAEIARLIGTTVDRRTVLNASYTIDYPANEYTLRDVLGYIAGAHGGNWIVTNTGKLLLVPLFSTIPPETNYLVTEYGRPITLGGVKILV